MKAPFTDNFLITTVKQFEYYKSLGEKTFHQLSDEQLFWKADQDANSIAIIVNHLSGNMLSRWTDFMSTDGEKVWRHRDQEFEDVIKTRAELIDAWEKGWACVFKALSETNATNFDTTIYIRNMGHTVTEAVVRQLCHYSYHIGQIVYLGRQMAAENWQSLSIPKHGSTAYNKDKFDQPKRKAHFTDEYLDEAG